MISKGLFLILGFLCSLWAIYEQLWVWFCSWTVHSKCLVTGLVIAGLTYGCSCLVCYFFVQMLIHVCWVCETFPNGWLAWALSYSADKDFSFGHIECKPNWCDKKHSFLYVITLIWEVPREIRFYLVPSAWNTTPWWELVQMKLIVPKDNPTSEVTSPNFLSYGVALSCDWLPNLSSEIFPSGFFSIWWNQKTFIISDVRINENGSSCLLQTPTSF